VSATAKPRLGAEERREALLGAALGVFSSGSYRGTTTAEIARAAGVSEPVLYRHFASKRDLYLACIDEAWRRLRAVWEEALENDPDPGRAFPAMARVVMCGKEAKSLMTELWMQAVVEAGDDVEVQRFLRNHMREVQEYVANAIRTGQESGAINKDRDPGAEAWIFISASLLGTIGRRLGLLTDDDFERIRDARRAWMTAP
jgi:AcrR family transcriptional regulator